MQVRNGRSAIVCHRGAKTYPLAEHIAPLSYLEITACRVLELQLASSQTNTSLSPFEQPHHTSRGPSRIWLHTTSALSLGVVLLALAGCSRDKKEIGYSPRVVQFGQAVPKGGGHYKLGAPYVVAGVRYVPRHQPHYDATGVASWYGRDFHGRLTANGEVYDMNAMTGAHPTLPLPSMVRVTNLENGRSVIVRVNDRGPYKHGRIIDLSAHAASRLDMKRRGTARVRVQYLGPARL